MLEGFYLPANLTAHVKLSKYTELSVTHEYFGHGGYCEHSKIGQFIRKYEQDMRELKENPPNVKLVLNLVKEFDNYMFHAHKYYEGWAYWLEKQYAFEHHKSHLFEEKMESISPYYHHLINQIDNFDKRNGRQATIDWLFQVEL